MSVVSITSIQVLNNPAPFQQPFQFEITFECNAALQEDLEWKIIYVGSAASDAHDQVLDAIMVGPVPVGVNKFIFQADPPNVALLPQNEVVGVTVVLITCSYRDKEFVRVGYYVNNDYQDEQLRAQPPATPQMDQLTRHILAEQPRVTRFPIRWDMNEQTDELAALEAAEQRERVDEEPEEEEDEEEEDEEEEEEGEMEEEDLQDEEEMEDEEDEEEDELDEEMEDETLPIQDKENNLPSSSSTSAAKPMKQTMPMTDASSNLV